MKDLLHFGFYGIECEIIIFMNGLNVKQSLYERIECNLSMIMDECK